MHLVLVEGEAKRKGTGLTGRNDAGRRLVFPDVPLPPRYAAAATAEPAVYLCVGDFVAVEVREHPTPIYTTCRVKRAATSLSHKHTLDAPSGECSGQRAYKHPDGVPGPACHFISCRETAPLRLSVDFVCQLCRLVVPVLHMPTPTTCACVLALPMLYGIVALTLRPPALFTSQVVASSSGTLHARAIARTTISEFYARHDAAVADAAHAGMCFVPVEAADDGAQQREVRRATA